jgi:hypothetical protein
MNGTKKTDVTVEWGGVIYIARSKNIKPNYSIQIYLKQIFVLGSGWTIVDSTAEEFQTAADKRLEVMGR